MPELRFGISPVPFAQTYSDVVAQVLAADQAGLDVVGIQDHPYQRRFLDTFSLIADLLARTDRLRIFPDVANLPLRGPTMIAKAAASLDIMSGGRFELGLGAGSFWQAVSGMGGPDRTPAQAAEALEEAVRVIRAALDGERVVRGNGPHYPIPGYPPGPPPAHRIEVWIGAYRPRGLRLIGQLADGWVPSLGYLGPNDVLAASAVIDEAAIRAGRDPTSIRRIYNISGEITSGRVGDGHLVGPVDLWVDTLADWVERLRMDTFVYWPSTPGTEEVVAFAERIVPRVREVTASSRPVS
jgi:alkanesulfonate monooxygenase SsuD/methylene tetrahydromethanopterin reductase-like flavin-dependent oxidoreductase (luciferase family)